MVELDNGAMLASIDFISEVDPEQKPAYWSDDRTKGTRQDTYAAHQHVFPDGQKKLVVSHDKFFIGPAITSKVKAARGKSENRERSEEVAGRRAKKQVSPCCNQFGADRMVTLTYRENMTDRVSNF